jgi:Fe2+ or Zn2+ uptake regulation protein
VGVARRGWWAVTPFTIREPRTPRDAVVDVLEEAEEPMTTAAIAEAVGRARHTVLPMLYVLEEAGCVRSVGGEPGKARLWEAVP